MDKIEAMNIIIAISNECENAQKCNKCAFYSVVEHIEGCVFDKLVQEINPCDFKKALNK